MKRMQFFGMLLFVATMILSCEKEEEITEKTVEKRTDVNNSSGGDGIIYGISPNYQLLWYLHEGRYDGSFSWASYSGSAVGTGWDFRNVFYGGDGVIYAIDQNNQLLWYRHEGRYDGSFRWASNSGSVVGTGWNFRHIFSD